MMSSVRTILQLDYYPLLQSKQLRLHKHHVILINIAQLTNDEFSSLINKAYQFKQLVKSDKPSIENHQKLLGKLVALLFTKRSTRTRISTEGAASFFWSSTNVFR